MAASQPIYADTDDIAEELFLKDGYERELTYHYVDLFGIE